MSMAQGSNNCICSSPAEDSIKFQITKLQRLKGRYLLAMGIPHGRRKSPKKTSNSNKSFLLKTSVRDSSEKVLSTFPKLFYLIESLQKEFIVF